MVSLLALRLVREPSSSQVLKWTTLQNTAGRLESFQPPRSFFRLQTRTPQDIGFFRLLPQALSRDVDHVVEALAEQILSLRSEVGLRDPEVFEVRQDGGA